MYRLFIGLSLGRLESLSSEASFKENLCWPGEGWPKVSKEKDAERREARRDVQRLMSKGTAAHGQHSTGQADGHGSCLMSLSRTSLQGVLGFLRPLAERILLEHLSDVLESREMS